MASPTQGFSQSSTTQTKETGSGGTILTLHKKGSYKKRAPSRIAIELSYENGVLFLQSSSVNGTLCIEFMSESYGEVQTISDLSIGESIMLHLNFGLYNVTAYDNDGTEFVGELLIE